VIPYQPHEDAILRAYLHRPVMGWDSVLEKLPGRSQPSASSRLQLLREQAGTVWKIPPYQWKARLLKRRAG
jgi:hypothetical protein